MSAYDASDDDDHIDAPGAEDGEGERVAKALARAGVASRREVERLIEDRKVALNGEVLTTPAVKVKPGDILTVNGKVVNDAEPTRLFRYHKPTGLMTSHNDPQGRPTVFAALPAGLPRLISVGRLDLNSEGLLLLTNDGALSRALELPSSNWPRQYRARAFGDTTQEKLDRLKDGVTVEGVKYGAIDAKLDKAKETFGRPGKNLWITVTLNEGKNREVRRVLEHLGLKVNRLIRLAYGPFVLGTLGQGEVEEVGPRVIREQLEGLVEAKNMPKGDRPQFTGGTSKAMPRRSQPGGMTAGLRAKADRAPAEPKPRPEYKAGWAKPKSKPSPHAPSKAPAKGPPKAKTGKPNWRDAPPAPKFGDAPAERAAKPFSPDKKRNPKAHGPRPSRPPERPGRSDRSETPEPGARTFVKSYARPAPKADRPPLPKEGAERRLDIAARATRERREGRSGPDRKGGYGKDAADTPYERARKEFGDRRPSAARPDSPARRDEAPQTSRGPRPEGPRPKPVRDEAAPRKDKRPSAKGGAFLKGGAHRSEAPKTTTKRPAPNASPARKGPPRGPKPR